MCSAQPFNEIRLEQEIGDELAALVTNADSDRSKGGLAFVVRGSPISKVGSLGDETANLSGLDHLFVSTTSAIEFLHEQGKITSAKRDAALEHLALLENPWPEKNAISIGSNCYLDDLTISYLQNLDLLNLFCGCEINVIIYETTQALANALQKQKQHLLKVETSLEELRHTLSHQISVGRAKLLANDSGEHEPEDHRRFWSHPTMSVFGSATSPDSMVVDDRFLNKHVTVDRRDGRSKVFTTLDILKTLQSSQKISNDDYFRFLNDLRQRGHLFVPLEMEELCAYVREAAIKEGQLRVGKNLLQIQAYYLLARFSDCLTVSDDIHWLLRSNRVVNDVIREQWKSAQDIQFCTAISRWLFDLIDLRLWIGDNNYGIQNNDIEDILVANVAGLLAPSKDASKEDQESYLAWIDADIVQPLKKRHSGVFQKIVSYYENLIADILNDNIEASYGGISSQETVLSAAITLNLFPDSIRQTIIAEQSLMNRFNLPVKKTVTFFPYGNKFMVEDLYDCAQSVFDGVKHVQIKEYDTGAIWIADRFDPEQATFLLKNGKSEITVDGYWPLQADPDKRLRSLESLASKFRLSCSLIEHWSAKVHAAKLSCAELILLERDVKRSLVVVSSRIRREIDNGSGNSETLVPSDPDFWQTVYPTTTDAPALAEFVEQEVKAHIVAGTKAYAVKFYPGNCPDTPI